MSTTYNDPDIRQYVSSNTPTHHKKHHIFWILGIISCSLALIGIGFLGILFIPTAFIVSVVAFVLSIIYRNWLGITLAAITWVLVIIGGFTLDLDPSIIGLPNPNPLVDREITVIQ